MLFFEKLVSVQKPESSLDCRLTAHFFLVKFQQLYNNFKLKLGSNPGHQKKTATILLKILSPSIYLLHKKPQEFKTRF